MTRACLIFSAAAAAILALSTPPVAAQTWFYKGGTGSWNTATNWSPASIPNSTTADAAFYISSGTVNIASSVQASSLTFYFGSGTYTITSSAGQTLSAVQSITNLSNNLTNIPQTLNLANVAGGSLLFPSGSALTITNNYSTFSQSGPSLVIGPNTVIGTTGSSFGVTVTCDATTQMSGSFASGANQVIGGLTKNGYGDLLLSGDNSNLEGPVTLNAGGTELSYATSTADKLGSGALILAGGGLALLGNGTTTVSQTVQGGTAVSAGQNYISAQANGGPGVTLNLSGIRRTAGATLDVFLESGTVVTTTAGLNNGILGGWATVGAAAWATTNGSNIVMLSTGSTSFGSGLNTDVGANMSIADTTTNSLRFTAPATLTLTGTLTLQSGGVLVPATAGSPTITGGTITSAGGSGELIFHVYGANSLRINSDLVTSGGLTWSTGASPLILGGNNNLAGGPVNVNAGDLIYTSASAVGNPTAINLNNSSVNHQTLQFLLPENSSLSLNTPIRLGITCGLSNTGQNVRITLSGVISSPAATTTPLSISTGMNSAFDLANTANTFTGNVTLNGGLLGIGSDGCLGNAANALILSSGLSTGGLEFLLDGTTLAHHVVVGSAGARVIADAANLETISGTISGGQLVKDGTGTLTSTGANTYTGGTTINNGILSIVGDASLGSGPVTIGAFGTLNYANTTSTAKSYNNAGGGTLSAGPGAVVTLNGSQITGGYLGGPGTFATSAATGAQFANLTTLPSVTIASNSGSDLFTNVTNGGTLNVAAGISPATPVTINGFFNQGSSSVAIGAGSVVSVSNFQTYGTLTLAPGSTAAPTQITNAGPNLYFNAGSRSFIGTPQTASQYAAGIDLQGHNAVVAGGLFVNNGYVVDSTNASPPVTVIADFGSLVKGAGFYQNSVQTVNGGKFQSGNSPGQSSFGSFTFGPGGVSNYIFAIDDATAAAGPSPDANGHVSGWGLVSAIQRLVGSVMTPGDFTWTADPAHPVSVHLDTLIKPTTVGTDIAGPMADFDPSKPYSWPAVQWAGTYGGPTDSAALNAATAFDTSGFANAIAGAFGWSLDPAGHTLALTYTPSAVPEPSSLLLLAAAGFGWFAARGAQFNSSNSRRPILESPTGRCPT